METMMKTAPAAPNASSKPKRDPLAERYGEIGISAVAAAAPFIEAPKPATPPKGPWRDVVAMD
jgi:hypothetical protein